MATSTVDLIQPSGLDLVTLSGSVKADSGFTTQPVATEQILWTSGQGVSVNGQLAIAGPIGTYDFWHLKLDGTAVKESYVIDGTIQASSSVDLVPPTGYSAVALSGTVVADGGFTVQPVVDDVIAFPSALTIDTQLNISGPAGTYTIYHFVAATGVAHRILYQVAAVGGFFSYVDLIPGSPNTLATLQTGFDPYVFEEWVTQPVVGEQLITLTEAGYFDNLGNYYSEYIHTHSAHHIALDGTTTHLTVDSTALSTAVDITPDTFTLQPLSGQSVNREVFTTPVTLSGMEPGEDSPLTVSQNWEWSYSRDGGQSYSDYTNSPGFVQNGDMLRFKTTTPLTYSTTKTCTVTIGRVNGIGGISVNWLVSTINATVDPLPFSYDIEVDIPPSTWVQSKTVTVLGVSPGVDSPFSVTNSQYRISTDGGDNYGDWATDPTTVKVGDMFQLQALSSATFGEQIYTSVTIGNTEVPFLVTTRQAITTPVGMTFPPLSDQPPNTTVNSAGIPITGVDAGIDISISSSGGPTALSTDGGQTYGPFLSAHSGARLNDYIIAQATTSAEGNTASTTFVTVGGVVLPFTVSTGVVSTLEIPTGVIDAPSSRTVVIGSKRSLSSKVFKQDATDILDYAIDLTGWLDDNDTVDSAVVVESYDLVSSSAKSTTAVGVFLTGGTKNDADRITIRVTTTEGRRADFSFYVAFLDY